MTLGRVLVDAFHRMRARSSGPSLVVESFSESPTLGSVIRSSRPTLPVYP